MKRSGIVATASLGLAMLAAGCGSSSVSVTPAQPSKSPSSASSPAHKAGVGDTIDLSDSTTGKNIAVTVVKVVDPDSSSNQIDTPSPGNRFESIQYRIVNSGPGNYQDDPFLEISATDAAGQNMQQDVVVGTNAGPQLPSNMNLTRGGTALGYVTFDVPNGDRIAQTQYSLNAGLSNAVGQWQIGSGQPAQPPAPSSPNPAVPSTPPPAPPPGNTNMSSPQTVVQEYFAAINAGNYALAWSLGGKNITHGSYNDFVQGFSTTSLDNATIVSTSGNTVTVRLDATQTDGSHQFFSGTYTVENGAIVSANVH